MDMNRRGFLKLFGLGAAGAVVAPKVGVSLFGSDEVAGPASQLAPSAQLGKHWVVYPRPFMKHVKPRLKDKPDNPLDWKFQAGGVVGAIQSPFPARPKVTPSWGLERSADVLEVYNGSTGDPWGGLKSWNTITEMVVEPEWVKGMDPHAAFYKASLKLREMFAVRSREVMSRVPERIREWQKPNLVTVVHNEIYARPGGTMSGRPYHEDDGFEVVCDADTVIMVTVPDLSEFTIYSDQGQFPIDVPSDIDMGKILKLDAEIVKDPKLASRRGFFASWRS